MQKPVYFLALVASLSWCAPPAYADVDANAPSSYGIAAGWPGGAGQVTIQQIATPTLQPLSLSPLTATAGSTYTGAISGNTAGSTLTLSNNDGGACSLALTTVTCTGLTAGSASIAVTETLPGAANSPKTTSFTITVNALPSVTYDTSLGAALTGDGFYGTRSSISSQGTDTKEVTVIANIYCDHTTNTTSALSCRNALLMNSWEQGPSPPNDGPACEAAIQSPTTTPWASGICLGMDTSLQWNLNGPYGANPTTSSPYNGDANDLSAAGSNGAGFNSLAPHQLVITFSDDSSKACNSGGAPNCYDVLIDGVSVKSQYSMRYFAFDQIINLYSSHGINVWNNNGNGIGSVAWLKSLYLSNRAILDYSTGAIDGFVISTKLFASGQPISYGSGNCNNVDGQAPLICLVGNGPGMFTTNYGTLTGLSYQARASAYSGNTPTLFTPLQTVSYPSAMPGATVPTGPYLKWPITGIPTSANVLSDTSGFQVGEQPGPGGMPVAVGDLIGYVVHGNENSLGTHNPQCSALEDGVAWTQTVQTDAGPGGNAYAQTVLFCTRKATASDLSDATHHPVYAPSWTGAFGRSVGWFFFDYTNGSAFGNIASGNSYTNGTLTIPALTTTAGSTQADFAFFGAQSVTPTMPTGDTLRYSSYGLTGSTPTRVMYADAYGVSGGTQATKTVTVTQSSANGVAFTVEIKQ